jgi:hypothetical protein
VVREDAVYAVLVPPLVEKRGLKPAQIKSGMDYSLVDMGIAMSHFHLACRAEERPGGWALFGDDQPEMKANLQIPGENRLIAVWK